MCNVDNVDNRPLFATTGDSDYSQFHSVRSKYLEVQWQTFYRLKRIQNKYDDRDQVQYGRSFIITAIKNNDIFITTTA